MRRYKKAVDSKPAASVAGPYRKTSIGGHINIDPIHQRPSAGNILQHAATVVKAG
jgi:hypothetical protein